MASLNKKGLVAMKLFANIREIAKILFRQNGQEIGLDSNTSTTYTADRNVELPPGDTDSVLVGAANTQVLTNKTIDGDDNTVQDLPLTAIKTVLGDADKVLLRDAAGIPISAKIVNANIDAAAAIDATKIGNGDVDNTELSKLNGLSGNITTDTNTQTLTNKTLTSPVINTPTGIVKGDVGLGNVDNTSDATKNSAAVTLTNKTIDGDDNTVQDLALSSLKTVLGDADKVIRRNASGVVVSDNAIPNSSTILTTDATQILSNKELDQPVMNGQIVSDYIDMEEVAAPGNPTAGTTRYYTKTDGLLYSRDNAGVESPVGSGASNVTSTTYGLVPPQTGRSTGNLSVTSWSTGTATVVLARTRAYQLTDGQWRVQFNIKISLTGSSATNSGTFTITGITAKDDTNGEQGICMAHQANQQGFSAYISPNTGNCTWFSSGNLVDGALHIFGDIEVESKPSWA